MLADPVAVAVQSTVVSEELQASRERIVAAREEERRRLRRELHDGLGPHSTGIAFAADAAANTMDDDPEQSQRPADHPASRHAEPPWPTYAGWLTTCGRPRLTNSGWLEPCGSEPINLSWRADGASREVRLRRSRPGTGAACRHRGGDLPDRAPKLSPMSYATPGPRAPLVRLRCAERLEVSITDNGPPNGALGAGRRGCTRCGSRLRSSAGSFQAGPTPTGGQVVASFP